MMQLNLTFIGNDSNEKKKNNTDLNIGFILEIFEKKNTNIAELFSLH